MTHLLCTSSDNYHFMELACSFLEDLISLLFFMRSHPLQLAYLIFFSPYLISMLSFLTPLLLTCSLLLLLLLTIGDPSPTLPDICGKTCRIVMDSLKKKLEVKYDFVEDVGFVNSIFSKLEACLDCATDAYEEETMPVEKDAKERSFKEEEDGVFEQAFPSTGLIGWEEFEAIGRLYKALTQEVGEQPLRLAIRNLKKKKLLASDLQERNTPTEVLSLEGWKTPSLDLEGSEAEFPMEKVSEEKLANGLRDLTPKSLERYDSVRREQEWRRTLACKLYEERWSGGGVEGDVEGMDLLWEEAHKVDGGDEKKIAMEQRSKSKKKNDCKRIKNATEEEQVEQGDEEEDEEDEMVGQFCCLQALKFSNGKMRFGIGKKMGKLVKMTKALKGAGGLFHHSARSKKE